VLIFLTPSVFKNSFMDSSSTPKKFFPSGAIAFFVLLVILCLIIWFGVYYLMIART
jgi:hypothetical protein